VADEELQIEDTEKKSKLPLIIILVVVLIAGGGAAWFFLFSGSDEPAAVEQTAAGGAETQAAAQGSESAEVGTALYVAMPRPFVFNVPGTGRDRLVQIKAQLMVRGGDNEETAKMHIPLIEGTLLQVFSGSNADELVTEAGKVTLREQAATEVQKVMQEMTGDPVVERVLFTGFVMQ